MRSMPEVLAGVYNRILLRDRSLDRRGRAKSMLKSEFGDGDESSHLRQQKEHAACGNQRFLLECETRTPDALDID
jgi:hypothetical protein